MVTYGRGGCSAVILLAATACTPQPMVHNEMSGAALLVDMHPTGRPPLNGAYDFELLDEVSGKGCATRGAGTTYWIGLTDLTKYSSDQLTRQAIAAAAIDSIGRLDKVDTLLVTRVVAAGQGPDKVCATVVGRAIHLFKSGEPAPSRSEKPVPPPPLPGHEDDLEKTDKSGNLMPR